MQGCKADKIKSQIERKVIQSQDLLYPVSHSAISFKNLFSLQSADVLIFYYIGSAEGHEYPDLQVGDEVNPRPFFVCS